jgi:hypothetical protein
MYQYEAIASVRIIVEAESQEDAHERMMHILTNTVYDVETLEIL